MNAGDFAASVETFTLILAAYPQDSLSYRLRGNAYDNLGDRQKAIEDWTQAARLGDTIIQSYLDYLGVKWRETPAPSHPKSVIVIGNRDSKRYHLPGMKYYNLVKAYHRIVFQSEEEAIQAGITKHGNDGYAFNRTLSCNRDPRRSRSPSAFRSATA